MDPGAHETSRGQRVESVFHRCVDVFFRRWPRPAPPTHRLNACRIISHRGEHDNHTVLENTLAAFDTAAASGIWGIEMDVRWTRDLLPVVVHDADTGRLFDKRSGIGQLTLDRLRYEFPLIPTLAEVVVRYGGRFHLMLEIKAEPYPRPAVQARRMREHLRQLAPATDFHLMGFDPDMFAYFDFLPPAAFVPIARLRIDRFSRLAARHGWGGLAGHYLAVATGTIRSHHRLGQRIGTGFADSRGCLYREAARGVDWIFSNRAAEMQALCRAR